jgi:hypothetical protein
MRALNIAAVVAATLLVPSIAQSQDSGRAGGLVGPNLESTLPASWRMRGEQMRALSERANEPAVRAMIRRIAADCDCLAQWAERGKV